VRDTRWKYIHNGYPNRPYLQPNRYKDDKPIVQAMRRLYAAGELSTEQSLIMAETRPRDELYDTLSDPFELHNLASDPAQATRLSSMKEALMNWQERTADQIEPESEDVYRIEIDATRSKNGKQAENQQYNSNIDLMIKWSRERPLVR
jgi:hypothetical protein